MDTAVFVVASSLPHKSSAMEGEGEEEDMEEVVVGEVATALVVEAMGEVLERVALGVVVDQGEVTEVEMVVEDTAEVEAVATGLVEAMEGMEVMGWMEEVVTLAMATAMALKTRMR